MKPPLGRERHLVLVASSRKSLQRITKFYTPTDVQCRWPPEAIPTQIDGAVRFERVLLVEQVSLIGLCAGSRPRSIRL